MTQPAGEGGPGNLRAPDLIGRKRDGGELSGHELHWLVSGYLDG